MSSEAPEALPTESRAPNVRAATAPFSVAAFNFNQRADRLAEAVIYAMVIFSPWAFGCTNTRALPNWTIFGVTQVWTLWAMAGAGYLLGALVLAKLAVNGRTGYRPPRWGDAPAGNEAGSMTGDSARQTMLARGATPALALLTVAILLYCLISAVNARANYRPDLFGFEYFKNTIPWLPRSYDQGRTWIAFWNYLGLAGAFWGIGDWLRGKTAGELRAERKAAAGATAEPGRITLLPERLRRLLWVLSLNGALLALQGMAQRFSGTNKLLWYLPTRLNRDAESQFGPYAYRSNAAQYFNLLWPVVLGFWWTLWRAAEIAAAQKNPTKSRRHHWVLLIAVLIAVCPIISYSRGGAIVASLNLAVATLLLLAALKPAQGATKLGLFVLGLGTLLAAFALGGDKLGERMKDLNVSNRERMYDVGRIMAAEHPVFGTGPGSFDMLFQFYRTSPDEYWPAQLHNDWLETRITFGWVGSALIAAAFLVVVGRRYLPGGIRCGWRFAALIWLALAGCLAHARFDFPLQVHSVLFLFLILCAILFNLSRAGERKI